MSGTLLFARYAFMPNRLGYCGGDENKALWDYCLEGQSDPGLTPLLRQFQAAYPYLKLIAQANGLADPFDARVVEAYWVGNELLDRVRVAEFYDSLRTRFGKHLSPKAMGYLLGKAPLGARPHHSFHVFDVHSRIGMLEHNLDTMEKCRIGWGQVLRIEAPYLVVAYRPLVLESGQLKLGEWAHKRVLYQIDGRAYIPAPQVGDLVSFHWDWACEAITKRQARNLERYTAYHLALANLTL